MRLGFIRIAAVVLALLAASAVSARADIIVLCDVTNPLLGASGSARTFGPQKGASPRDVVFLESV